MGEWKIEFTDGRVVTISSKAVFTGHVMAAALSWTANQSVAWSLVHGILGWFYVVYYATGSGR